MAKYRMTNRELEEALREYNLLGKVISGLGKDRESVRGKIDSELKCRGITQYSGGTVDAEVKEIPSFDYLNKLLEEFSLQQLYDMGALNLNVGKFQEGSGKKKKDMDAYKTETGTTSRLEVKTKPAISREFLKEIRNKIRYPTSD